MQDKDSHGYKQCVHIFQLKLCSGKLQEILKFCVGLLIYFFYDFMNSVMFDRLVHIYSPHKVNFESLMIIFASKETC